MRKFIRHPSCVPIAIAIDESNGYAGGEVVTDLAAGIQLAPKPAVPSDVAIKPEADAGKLLNISAGGLAFGLLHPVQVGSRMTISMPQVWPDYNATGTVAWCREASEGYEAGVEFNEEDEAFKARMVAQFCQIEDYRRDVREREGRALSSDEAAREWIVRHAQDFAETLGWQ